MSRAGTGRGKGRAHRGPRHAAPRRAVPQHLPPYLAVRTTRSRRFAIARYAQAAPSPYRRPGSRDERFRWATTALVAVTVAVIGLIAVTIAPVGFAPGPTVAAAEDGYAAEFRSTTTVTAPVAETAAAPAAFTKTSPRQSSRDRARVAALAGNRGAQRSDTLIADVAERIATEQVRRESARTIALASTSKAARAAAQQALATKIAAEQRAKLQKIRIDARAKAGLQPESSGSTTDQVPVTAAASSSLPGPVPSIATGPTVTSGSGPSASPILNGVIGARFGQVGLWSRYHTGIDYRAAYGTPVHAAADGEIVVAGNTGDWSGNHVAVRHADGTTTMYSHLSSIDARVGEQVGAGQVIGYVGSTGRAFGAHLHFEVYPPGVSPGDVYRAVNPMPWLAARGVRTA